MTKETDEFIEASNVFERLLRRNFDLIAEVYCEEIAEQLWNVFMKERIQAVPPLKEDEALEPSRQDFERLMTCFEILGKLHGLDRK